MLNYQKRMHKMLMINFTAQNTLKGNMPVSVSMFTFGLSGSDLKLDRWTWLHRFSSAISSVTCGNKSSNKRCYVTNMFILCIDKQLMSMLTQPKDMYEWGSKDIPGGYIISSWIITFMILYFKDSFSIQWHVMPIFSDV